MTCPHALLIPWGRDDEAVQCKLDDGPCDKSREGYCREWPDEHEREVKNDSKQTDSGRHLRRQDDVVRQT